jgi:hypothetical protein
VPNPAERPGSSLGYMMKRVSDERGDGRTGWYLRGDDLLFARFEAELRDAIRENQRVCLASTAFGLVRLLEEMDRRGICLALPTGSRVMETGGFKGRTRIVDRDELYGRIAAAFALADDAIVAEYGMTELTSQYYDADPVLRRKAAPPWLRARVVGPERKTLPNGELGALLHVDLANRSSCVAIQTEDLGVQFDDGLVLIGRDREASPRGCSLDAEELRAIASRTA